MKKGRDYELGLEYEIKAEALTSNARYLDDQKSKDTIISEAANYWGAAGDNFMKSGDFKKAGKAFNNAKNSLEKTKFYEDKEGGIQYFHKKGEEAKDQRLGKVKDYLQKRKQRGGLEKSAITTIIGILLGLFFLSPNITGNVIGNSRAMGNWVGGVLLAIGLVAGFISIQGKKKKVSSDKKQKTR